MSSAKSLSQLSVMSPQTGPCPASEPPSFESSSQSSLLFGFPDHHLPYIVPVVVYWTVSFVFHYIDSNGLLSAYKIHTPAEDLTKNRATKKNVIKFAIFQQACQCAMGYLTSTTEPFVPHEYSIAAWAHTIRYGEILAARWIRSVGIDVAWITDASKGIGGTLATGFSLNSGNSYVGNISQVAPAPIGMDSMHFSVSETIAAQSLYWIIVPLFQYLAVMVLADTFQYFTHRALHENKWLYKHIHSMHHEIYVPYAYGAFYNHPLETIPIDMIGFPICLAICGLNNHQSTMFGAVWTFKTVVDHCGYDFPYNPCNIVCPNSVLFHDLHHQRWGMKHNFSVYGSFWDWLMGTKMCPHDPKAQEKYQRARENVEAASSRSKLEMTVSSTSLGRSTALEL